ncbi:MAG: recombinase family protein [Rhodospirillaceae bacterium]
MGKFVAYYRCSTQKQFSSHLGLEGQQAAVLRFLSGRDHELLAQYTEVESGRHADRPRLAEALAYAKRHRATLVIARLDRLARSVAFVATLMEAGVNFTACDLENASPLTLHIFAAVAEAEARNTSERTKAAMAAARARGIKLGNTVRGGSIRLNSGPVTGRYQSSG